MKQPGRGRRHCDADGEISRKHGTRTIGSLRSTYGEGFAPGLHGNTKLSTALQDLDRSSLNQLVKNPPRKARGRK